MTDDRIVLPLIHTRQAAALLCDMFCGRQTFHGIECGEAGHRHPCLIPLLVQRDELLAQDAARRPTQGIDPDCLIGGAKHLACTGCLCDCHRHSNRGAA